MRISDLKKNQASHQSPKSKEGRFGGGRFAKSGTNQIGAIKTLPMQHMHIPQVLELIEAHDEDDAEAAEISYQREGLENQYILCQGDDVVGVTGYRAAENTHATAWLSWTYISESLQGSGTARVFVGDIIEKCRSAGKRKLYVSTSDYVDDEDGDIYADARRFYKSLGFVQELTLPDYFDEGESKLIYSLDLNRNLAAGMPSWSAAAGFKCVDAYELLECDDTYTLGFEINDQGDYATEAEIKQYVAQARQQGAARIYVGLPSDATFLIRLLVNMGFDNRGKLKDYYQAGVSEENLRYDF